MTITPQMTITEDGEAIGTLHQFADRLDRSRAFVLRCVHNRAQDAVILDAGEGLDRLLILDSDGYQALHRCVSPPQET
jgi:hypothetical protein